MPLIELWKGIKFKLYFHDHNPPHFHVLYQGSEATFRIDNCELIDGKLAPQRIHKLVREWWGINKDRLATEWERLSDD